MIKLISTVITRASSEWNFPCGAASSCFAVDGFCRVAVLDRRGRWIANGILEGYADRIEGITSTFNTALQILVMSRKPRRHGLCCESGRPDGRGDSGHEKGRGGFRTYNRRHDVHKVLGRSGPKRKRHSETLSIRGYPFHDPLYTLIFLPNDFLPEVGIDKGVVDMETVLWPADCRHDNPPPRKGLGVSFHWELQVRRDRAKRMTYPAAKSGASHLTRVIKCSVCEPPPDQPASLL